MRWAGAMVLAAALVGAATSASATTYNVDVTFPANVYDGVYVDGGTSFNPITLKPGDTIDIDSTFNKPISLEKGNPYSLTGGFSRVSLDFNQVSGNVSGQDEHNLAVYEDSCCVIKDGTTGFRFDFAGFPDATISVFGVNVFAVVPEPSTWLLMSLGIGLIGFGLRRRRHDAGPVVAPAAA